ncbi:hypothetical protein PISMIDRAFT_676969, partial [Pisolithus microcarpus 441]
MAIVKRVTGLSWLKRVCCSWQKNDESMKIFNVPLPSLYTFSWSYSRKQSCSSVAHPVTV